MNIIDFNLVLKDKRLIARGKHLVASLFNLLSCSILSLSKNRAEQKGFYNFLNSPKLKEDAILCALTSRCNSRCSGRIVLSISDTTDINLTSHSNRIKKNDGYGVLDNNRTGIGIKMHTSVVVDATTLMPLGISSNEFIVRNENNNKTANERRKALIGTKESSKWMKAVKDSQDNLTSADKIVFIQDREGDIYEQLVNENSPENSYLLIRSSSNRRTETEERLFERILNSPVVGTYTSVLSDGGNRAGKQKEADFEVRVVQVQFEKPDKKPKEMANKTQPIYVIETRQISNIEGEPIIWRLITTFPLTDFQSIRTVIGWYEARWYIEEVFRVLKKEVIDIESCELEDAYSIRKFILIILETIISLFQLHIAYNEPEECYNPELTFDKEEQKCMELINENKIKATTQKQANPFNKDDLKYYTWTLYRLGGWKGYQSQRKPGITTMIKGLQAFYQLYDGYNLAKKVGTR